MSFAEKIYVVNWFGFGVTDLITTITRQNNEGSTVTKTYAPERQIIINVRVFNEKQKQRIYDLFPTRVDGTLTYIPDNDLSQAKEITCRVSSLEPQESKFPAVIPVVLLCPDPFWRSPKTATIPIVGKASLWQFPWEIPLEKTFEFSQIKSGNSAIFNNDGTVETGFTAHVATTQPITFLRLTNYLTKEYMEINGEFAANSQFIFSTVSGDKKIYHRTSTKEKYTDVSDLLKWGSTFFKIAPKTNRIMVEATNGTAGLDVYVNFTVKYGGV